MKKYPVTSVTRHKSTQVLHILRESTQKYIELWCTWGLEGKEKQVVASFLPTNGGQLDSPGRLHNVSSSIQSNAGFKKHNYWKWGKSVEPKKSAGKDVRISSSIGQHHLPQDGQDMIVKGLWGHGYGGAGIIVVELGDQRLEIQLDPAPDPCSAGWRVSQEKRYEPCIVLLSHCDPLTWD